jgi:hypothetical protein
MWKMEDQNKMSYFSFFLKNYIITNENEKLELI